MSFSRTRDIAVLVRKSCPGVPSYDSWPSYPTGQSTAGGGDARRASAHRRWPQAHQARGGVHITLAEAIIGKVYGINMPDAKPPCQFTALTRKSQKMPAAEEAHYRSNKECQRLGCSRGHFPPRDYAGEDCKGLLCALPETLRFAFRSRGSVQDAPPCEFPPFPAPSSARLHP